MKFRLLFSLLLLITTVTVYSQSLLDSINWKQVSIGYNVLRPSVKNETSFDLPMLFVKYRTNMHSFGLSVGTATINKGFLYGYDGFPSYIKSTDSNLIIRYNTSYKTGGTLNLCYEKYEHLQHNDNIEFYVGAALTAGSIRAQQGYNDVTYNRDSLGILMMNDSLSQIYHQGTIGNYRKYKVGVTPYCGFLFLPDKVFSLAFETSAPFVYEQKIPFNSFEKNSSGVYFNLLFSINLIVNFDMNFTHFD